MTENNLYSDEALTADLDGLLPGTRRRAEILLPVPEDVRGALDGEAWTMQNYQGGRYSDCLRAAVATWKQGRGFPFRARAAAHREAERKANEGNFGPRKIIPMN